MLKFTITPFDVLFFGDGKPFNKGADAASLFPPLPNTFASAVFARMYLQKGITYDKINSLINAVYGPFLQKHDTMFFPAPMDVVKKVDMFSYLEYKDFSCNRLIHISNTDLGDTLSSLLWLTGKSDKDIKPISGYISINGLKKWYNNETLNESDFLELSKIFEYEDRIGIHINDDTGTTNSQDGLYRVNYVRLKKDLHFVFWVDFNLNNLNNHYRNEDEILQFYQNEPKVLKLGGESKNAFYKCEINDFHSLFKNWNSTVTSETITKYLFLTPAIFEAKNEMKNIVDVLPQFKTGITGRYIIAGINSKSIGTKTIRAIPAGSIIYCEKNSPGNSANTVDFLNPVNDFIGTNLVLKK